MVTEDIDQLNRLVAQTFQSAQKNVATHRKLVASLKNIYEKSVNAELQNEFFAVYTRMVNRVLVVRKSESCGDRVVKFIESFISSLQNEEQFIEALIKHLLRGVEAKDKNVRFRCCQIIAIVINHLGEMSDEIFELLKYNLVRRLYDKEQGVRLQCVLALSRLQGVDEEEDDDDVSITSMLVTVLQNDSSADVRRAVLFNLEKSAQNLPYLLERAWDTHPTNRRSVYSKTMKEIGDFRLLKIKMREKILQWGLRDRDGSVKSAATKMFVNQWVEAANNDLLEVLERLDVMNSEIAETAMLVFFENRKDTLDKIEFSADFWQTLTAESVFLARTFNEFCVTNKMDNDRMPELSKLASLIEYYLQQENDAESIFIVEQLFIIAKTYDFGDEVGRRNMLSLCRNALATKQLTTELIRGLIQVLNKLSVSETDFSQVVTEIVVDIQDELENEQNQENQMAAMLTCLSIAQSVLELCQKPLENNVHLTSLLNSLIIPAVRSQDTPIRERGVRCLGLASLLNKDLALENMELFMLCFSRGHEELKMEAVRILSDILMVHGQSLLEQVDEMSVYKMYYKAAKNSEEQELQALAAEALCKLVMAGIFTDDDLIKALILIFFDSGTASNEALKQILSFCMPVYCYSSVENQQRVGRVVVDAVRRLAVMYETDSEMVTPTVMLQQLIDWTDPQKNVVSKDSQVHLDLSVDMLKRIRSSEMKDERKALCLGLSKLHFASTAPIDTLDEIHAEALNLEDEISDSVSKNALIRFSTTLGKAIEKLRKSSSGEGDKVKAENNNSNSNDNNDNDDRQGQDEQKQQDENERGDETVRKDDDNERENGNPEQETDSNEDDNDNNNDDETDGSETDENDRTVVPN